MHKGKTAARACHPEALDTHLRINVLALRTTKHKPLGGTGSQMVRGG